MEAMEMGLGGNAAHIGGVAERRTRQCFKSGRNQAVFSQGERIAYGVGRTLRKNQAARDVGAARERFEAWVKGSTFATGMLRTRFIPPRKWWAEPGTIRLSGISPPASPCSSTEPCRVVQDEGATSSNRIRLTSGPMPVGFRTIKSPSMNASWARRSRSHRARMGGLSSL